MLPAHLEAAVPLRREWRLASLPRMLSDEEVARLINTCNQETSIGLRNRAILVLLSGLGLQAKQVAELCLDDIDWVEGRLLIRAGKSHRERSLLLPQDVGQTLITSKWCVGARVSKKWLTSSVIFRFRPPRSMRSWV